MRSVGFLDAEMKRESMIAVALFKGLAGG